MIKEFVERWDKYKDDLRDYFKNNKQEEYPTYEDIVKALFEYVINKDEGHYDYDIENITVIDDGDYQGTLIFILHKSKYQPEIENYIYTNVYYGSCSHCDTLKGIQSWDLEELPNNDQVDSYMTLALHILQKCHFMYDYKEEED